MMASKQGIKVAVLDPFKQEHHEWGRVTYITHDSDDYLEFMQANYNVMGFVDEVPETMGQANSNKLLKMQWLATQGRHNGHYMHFLAQRAKMVAPNVRNSCMKGIIFHQKTIEDCNTLVQEYPGKPWLADLYDLPPYQYYALGFQGMDPSQRYSLKLAA